MIPVRILIAWLIVAVFVGARSESPRSFRNATGPGAYEVTAFRAWSRIPGRTVAKDSTVHIWVLDKGKKMLSDSLQSVPVQLPIGSPKPPDPFNANDIESQIIMEMRRLNQEYQARGFDTIYEHPFLPFDPLPEAEEKLLTLVAVYRFPGHSDFMLLRYMLKDKDSPYSYPSGADFLVLAVVPLAKAYVLYCNSGMMDWNFSRILHDYPHLFGEDWALAALVCVSSVSEGPLALLGNRQDLETAVKLHGQFRRIPLAKDAPPEDVLWLSYPSRSTSLESIAKKVAATREEDEEIRRIVSLRPDLLDSVKIAETGGNTIVTLSLLDYGSGFLSRWKVSFTKEPSAVTVDEEDGIATNIFLTSP